MARVFTCGDTSAYSGGAGGSANVCTANVQVEPSALGPNAFLAVCENGTSVQGDTWSSCSSALYWRRVSDVNADSLIATGYGGSSSSGWKLNTAGTLGVDPAGGTSWLPELAVADAMSLFGAALPLFTLAWIGWFIRRQLFNSK